MNTHVDIAIVGGGLVGASAALALAKTSLSIALIDAAVTRCDDARLFALSESSCQLLDHLELWSSLKAYATFIREVQVSYQRRFGALHLKQEQHHATAELGYVVPAHRIEAVMQAALHQHPHIRLYRPARVAGIEKGDVHHRLMINQGNEMLTLTAGKIIAADGTHSTVRSLLNIPTQVHDYQQTAIVTRTQLTRSHQHIAYERFLADGGAIAMLPLMHDECATIWTGPNALMTHLRSLTMEAFVQALQQAFGYRLGRLQYCHERHSYPLQMVRAKQAVKDNVILIGNAAHTLHPIAAQGFNLALYEVAVLATGLSQQKTLATIYQSFTSPLTTSLHASHGIARLFAAKAGILSAVLPLGMVGLDMVAPLKRHVLARLLGQSRHTPPLLRAKDNDALYRSGN